MRPLLISGTLAPGSAQSALFATGHENDAFVLATRIPTLLRIDEFEQAVPRLVTGRGSKGPQPDRSFGTITAMPSYSPRTANYQFGPGGMTPAIRAIIYANIAVFLITSFAPGATVNSLLDLFGLVPKFVMTRGWIWQLATYLFLHGSLMHILFNMLAVWMFGVELERRWGTRAFTTYYFVTGIGAGLTTVLVSLLPFASTAAMYRAWTIGASGSVYALLLAWAILFPHRVLMFFMLFPLPARVYALLMGAIAFYSALGSSGSGVAHFTHLGGLAVGYWYLKGPRGLRDLKLEIQYRLTKWRMDRMRKKFDVHRGGRVH